MNANIARRGRVGASEHRSLNDEGVNSVRWIGQIYQARIVTQPRLSSDAAVTIDGRGKICVGPQRHLRIADAIFKSNFRCQYPSRKGEAIGFDVRGRKRVGLDNVATAKR